MVFEKERHVRRFGNRRFLKHNSTCELNHCEKSRRRISTLRARSIPDRSSIGKNAATAIQGRSARTAFTQNSGESAFDLAA